MKKLTKFVLPAALVVAFVGYALYQRLGSASSTQNPVATGTTSPVPSPVASSGAVATAAPAIAYKDGTYTGSVADAYFGNLQVEAVVSGGALTDVQFLQYPTDQGTSRQISAHSMPILKSEAITAQTAQVSIVSGATQTSQAFIESLSSALAQAKV